MTLDELLDQLEGVRKQRGGHMARCPSHEDRQQSLSVKETEEGQILLHCFAGCATTQIVADLGLRMTDLAAPPDEETVYVYTDEHNAPLYEVVRFTGKQFRQRLPDGSWGLGDVRRVLYRLPEVIAAKSVVIVEGEKDADTIRAHGLVATCNVGGAGKWKPEYSKYLEGKHVLVVADKDEPGRKHAHEIRHHLEGVAATVKLVQPRKGKDITDHFEAGLKLADLIPLKDRRIDGVVSSGEMADRAIQDVDRREPDRSSFHKNPWGIPEPEFVPGRLYVMGALTSGGKTSAALQLFRSISEAGVRACFVTMEMTDSDLKNRLLCHRGFKLKELERPWLMPDDWKARVRAEAAVFRQWKSEIVYSTVADAKMCSDLIAEGDIEFLIFDHLHQVLEVAGGEEKQIATQIRAFRNLALDWEIPVLVLSQFKRPFIQGAAPSLSDFKGSSAIEQNANLAMALHQGSSGYELHILKNRDGQKGVFYLSFNGPAFSFGPVQTETETQW